MERIQPYGAAVLRPLYVEKPSRRQALREEAESLPSLELSSAAAGNVAMLGAGYFSPLTGFMNLADAQASAARMRLCSGLFWPVPIVNVVPEEKLSAAIKKTDRIALRDPNLPGGGIIAIQEIESIQTLLPAQAREMAGHVFGTTDPEHPGVTAFLGAGDRLLSGSVKVLEYASFRRNFPQTFCTAPELRAMIAERGWKKAVGFQTRNPMHLAHEELCRMAQLQTGAEGIVIHMLLGRLKAGDIPAEVRDAAIRCMVERYFPPNSVLITGYGFDMLYAGPREALLQAIFRQNAGMTHFIIGRDHAGVGAYYSPFAAQDIFNQIPPATLQIEIFQGDHTVWCFKCDKVVMMRNCPHEQADYLLLSGTRVREMLSRDEALPREFARPEVAEILSAYYRSLQGG